MGWIALGWWRWLGDVVVLRRLPRAGDRICWRLGCMGVYGGEMDWGFGYVGFISGVLECCLLASMAFVAAWCLVVFDLHCTRCTGEKSTRYMHTGFASVLVTTFPESQVPNPASTSRVFRYDGSSLSHQPVGPAFRTILLVTTPPPTLAMTPPTIPSAPASS